MGNCGTDAAAPGAAHAEFVCEKAAAWIGSADAKATALVTLLGVVLGLVSIGIAQQDPLPDIRLPFAAFVGLTLAAVITSLAALYPRVDRKAYIPKGDALPSSPTFYGDLARLGFEEFRALCRAADPKEMDRDAVEQAYVLTKIVAHKMRCLRYSVVLTGASLVALVSVVFIAAAK